MYFVVQCNSLPLLLLPSVITAPAVMSEKYVGSIPIQAKDFFFCPTTSTQIKIACRKHYGMNRSANYHNKKLAPVCVHKYGPGTRC